jgi:hypothetical protein
VSISPLPRKSIHLTGVAYQFVNCLAYLNKGYEQILIYNVDLPKGFLRGANKKIQI